MFWKKDNRIDLLQEKVSSQNFIIESQERSLKELNSKVDCLISKHENSLKEFSATISNLEGVLQEEVENFKNITFKENPFDSSSIDKRIIELERCIRNHNSSIEEITNKIDLGSSELNQLRQDVNSRFKLISSSIDEKMDIHQEHTDSSFVRLEKIFSEKINSLSNLTPNIADLLKKIAYLEGIKEKSENRRKTPEIVNELSRLTDLMLKNDREEKNIDSLKEQVNILKWVLGEK